MNNKLTGENTKAFYNLDDTIDRFGEDSYHYNIDGYLETKTNQAGTSRYTYGSLGELKEVILPNGDIISYEHNVNNQRVARLKNGVITDKYLWLDLTTLLATYDKDNNLKQRYNYADGRMPVSYTQNGNTYYISYNQVGSPRVITDSNGNIIKEITYDSFGNILSDTNPSIKIAFGFAGGLYDEDTKLNRFGYRDYDSHSGKWTSKDPIGLAGGDTNILAYVGGDPVNFVDPSGEIGLIAAGAIGGGLVGIFVSFVDPCTGEFGHFQGGRALFFNTVGGAAFGALSAIFSGATLTGLVGSLGVAGLGTLNNYFSASPCQCQ